MHLRSDPGSGFVALHLQGYKLTRASRLLRSEGANVIGQTPNDL